MGSGQGAIPGGAQAPQPTQPRYRLALLATVTALGAIGLVQRQLTPGTPLGRAPAAPAPQVGSLAPAAANPGATTAPAPGQASPTPAPRASAAAPGSAPGAPELVVITSGPSWIELRDSQGRTTYAGLLEGRKRVQLGAGLSLKAGRPELVQIQLGAGPARPLPPGDWWTWHRFMPPGA